MIEVLSTYTRPHQIIVWHEPITLSAKLTKKYGKKRTVTVVENTDAQLTVRTTWDSEASKNAFEAEPEIVEQLASIKEYHELVGIEALPKVINEIEG